MNRITKVLIPLLLIACTSCVANIKSNYAPLKPVLYKERMNGAVTVISVTDRRKMELSAYFRSQQPFDKAYYDRSVSEIVHEALETEISRAGMSVQKATDTKAPSHGITLKAEILEYVALVSPSGLFNSVLDLNVALRFIWVDSNGKIIAQNDRIGRVTRATTPIAMPAGKSVVEGLGDELINSVLPSVIEEELRTGYKGFLRQVAADNDLKDSEITIEDIPEAVVDVDQNIPKNSIINNDAIAVVIGNKDYKNTKRVDYSINDALTVKHYLIEALGFKEGNIFFITNASKSDFELYFGNDKRYKGKLYNAVKEGKSDVFVYYSGHGAPGLKDKKGYFVPVEADPNYLELSGYSADVFYENLSQIQARSITVVLDACFSGATIYEKISPMVLEINNPVVSMKNGVVLSSSTGSQVSSWYDEKKHGMFTYFFLKAIHNRNADADNNGKITFDEIYHYISDKSEGIPYYARRIHGIEQNPTIEGNYQNKIFVQY